MLVGVGPGAGGQGRVLDVLVDVGSVMSVKVRFILYCTGIKFEISA